ncbi:hypothetical protein D3C81_2238290 [compost metagenome]
MPVLDAFHYLFTFFLLHGAGKDRHSQMRHFLLQQLLENIEVLHPVRENQRIVTGGFGGNGLNN